MKSFAELIGVLLGVALVGGLVLVGVVIRLAFIVGVVAAVCWVVKHFFF